MNKLKLGLFFAVLFVGTFTTLTVNADHQSWHSCTPIELGRCKWHSYFDNELDTDGDPVFPSGSYGDNENGMPVGNVNEFIDEVYDNLNDSSSGWARNAARFLIQSMMGVDGEDASTGITQTSAIVVEWEARVRALDAAGKINWDKRFTLASGTLNSYRQDGTGGQDFAFYETSSSQTRDIIEITDYSDNVVFRIKKNCGNPIGPLGELPPIEREYWNYDDTGQPTISDYSPYGGDPIDITGSVENEGDGTGPSYDQRIEYRYDGTGSWTTVGSADTGVPALTSGSTGRDITRQFDIPDSISDGRQICFRIWYDPGAGQSKPTLTETTGAEASQSRCVNVENKDWDYNSTGAPSVSTTNPKAGGSVTITGNIRNDGNGRGRNFEQRIQYRYGTSGSWTTVDTASTNNSYLAAGATSSNFSRTFSVPNTDSHNQQICFRHWFDPSGGSSTPLNTNSNDEASSQTCVNVYNLRFNNQYSLSRITPSVFTPGITTGTATFRIANTQPITPSQAARGSSSALTVVATSTNSNATVDSVNGSGTSSATLPAIAADGSRPAVVEFTLSSGVQPGDDICIRLDSSPDRWFSDGTSTEGSTSQTECRRVGEAPYIEVNSGDVLAGGAWDPNRAGGSVCGTADGSSNYIRAHNAAGRGSFAEFTVTALDAINGFKSGSVNTNTLSFANQFGPSNLGEFSDNLPCITDFYEYLDKSRSGPGRIGLTVSGQYFYSGDTNLRFNSAANITGQVIIIVDGDVTLDENTRAGSSGSRGDQAPFLMIVASGDINITSNVTDLYGVFVSKGTINTCSDGPDELVLNDCNQRLNVRGQFIAEDIEFRRTNGGLFRNGPAEVFTMPIELLLAQPNYVTEYRPSFKTVQIKDLPPVY